MSTETASSAVVHLPFILIPASSECLPNRASALINKTEELDTSLTNSWKHLD